MSNTWTDEEHAALVAMAAAGATGREIASTLGKTRNAVMGRAFRTGVKLPIDTTKTARMRKGRAPGTPRRRPPADHPICRGRPRGERAYRDEEIAVAIAARLAGQSLTKAAALIGASGQSITRNWMKNPALVAAGQALYQRARADAAMRAQAARELAAFEAETRRLTIERTNWPILGRMSERQRAIMEARIAGATLQAAAAPFGLSRERVRQIEVRWRMEGLVIPGARPLNVEAARKMLRGRGVAGYTDRKRHPAVSADDFYQRANAALARVTTGKRPYRISDAERQRRQEWGRTLAGRRQEARA